MTKALTSILCVFFMPILFVSCSSTPSISENATATQLIQMGQDALDIGNYKAAETCYKAVIEKYGEDINLYIEARYELGHMYLTRKKYGEAYAIFSEILSIYDNIEFGKIPGTFKKLAQIGIDRIPQKHRPN